MVTVEAFNSTNCAASDITVSAQQNSFVIDFDSNSAHWAAVPSNPLLQPYVPLRKWIVSNRLTLSATAFADHTSGSGNFLIASDTSSNPISFDLAYCQFGSGATLSFYYFNNAYGVATIASQLSVYVLDTSQTSTEVWNSGAASVAQWTPVSVDLSNYSGQTIKIRFIASTLGSAGYSDVGVDDINLQLSASNSLSSGTATVIAAVVVAVLFVIIIVIIVGVVVYRRNQWKNRGNMQPEPGNSQSAQQQSQSTQKQLHNESPYSDPSVS